MDHKEKLEGLHRESLEKIDEYLETKKPIADEHHEKLKEAKKEWQQAWAKMMDTLIVLERLEI